MRALVIPGGGSEGAGKRTDLLLPHARGESHLNL